MVALESVGTAAAVLQLASAAVKASVSLHGAITTIKNAPNEILNLGNDLIALSSLLKNLELALESPDARRIVDQDKAISSAMEILKSLITSCEKSCREVKEKLQSALQGGRPNNDPIDDTPGSDLLSSGLLIKEGIDIRRSIGWLFRRRGIFAAIEGLQQTKSLFSQSMGSLTLILVIKTVKLTSNGEAPPQVAYPFSDDAGSAIMDLVNAHPSPAERLSVSKSSSVLSQPPTQEPISGMPDPHMTEELLAAVRRGTIPVVAILLRSVHVNAQDARYGRTALSVAAETGNVQMAELLLEHGASVRTRQYSRSSWDDGQSPNETAGRNPLHWAAKKGNSDMVELLLKHGADPNSTTSIGNSALRWACANHDTRSVRLLLENKADVNLRSFYEGWRPIHEACHGNSFEIVQILLEYKPLLDVNVEFYGHRKSPLHWAVHCRNIDIMKALLSNGADSDNNGMFENQTPLHLAAAAGWLDGIKLLLDSNASINPMDAFLRETPLHKAARNLKVEACQLLCARGADIERKNVDGQNYESILNCARQYPDEWKVNPNEVYFLCT